MVYERAWALWGMGAALAAQSLHKAAGEALAAAADLFSGLGNDHLLSAVMLEQAALLAAHNEQDAAQHTVRQALDLVGDRAWSVQRFFAILRLADLLLPDDPGSAESLLLEAQTILADYPLPHLRFRWLQRIGRLYLLQGRDQEAEEELETAVRETEQVRGGLAREATRISFLHDKTDVYEDLIRLYLRRGSEVDLQKAFRVAEQAKSRALVDRLLGAVGVALDAEGDDPVRLERLQALQADLNAAYNELLGYSQDGERTATVREVGHRIQLLEDEIGRLRLASGGNGATLTPTPAGDLTLFQLGDELPPGVTLLAYHLLGDEVLAFVYHNGQLRVRRHLTTRAKVTGLLDELSIEWDRFRADPAFVKRQLPRLEQSARQLLRRLYDALIGPLAADLPTGDAARLAIVPHGLLHHVPFQALFDGERYLLERLQIGYAPSATVLALCSRRLLRRQGRAVVVGVADDLIPHVMDEARAVADHLPAADLLLNGAATVAAIRQRSTGCRLLHLACHGLFRADNPHFSALKLADGWLTAADVGRLTFSGAFVALSACESGRSEALGGDEIVGLVRAFLGAGATGLAVSLWLVEDKTTAQLMTTFYEAYAHREGTNVPGGDPELHYAAALRDAQLALKESHPHPYFWAPFIYVGRA
jgi:tetratricopeptide (TPR) repeat protein